MVSATACCMHRTSHHSSRCRPVQPLVSHWLVRRQWRTLEAEGDISFPYLLGSSQRLYPANTILYISCPWETEVRQSLLSHLSLLTPFPQRQSFNRLKMI